MRNSKMNTQSYNHWIKFQVRPSLKDYGFTRPLAYSDITDKDHNYMVMELGGPSLDEYF
jgi:hypothetical protein